MHQQPIHEAVRGGHLELLTYLIEEEEADVDIRTHDGLGATPLNIAKREHGMDHPIYLYLLDSGAKDLEGEEQGSEDDDERVDGGLDEEEDNGEEEEEYIIEEEEEEEDSRDDDGDGDGDDDDEMLEEKGEESETDNQTTMGDDL